MKFIKTIIVLLSFLALSAVMIVTSEESINKGTDDIIIEAISQELSLENVTIKLMGGGDQIMLEGEVSSQKTFQRAEQVAKQYSANVFNIINIKEPSISIIHSLYLYKKLQNSPVTSRYKDILINGDILKKHPWHFLIFSQSEVKKLQSDLVDIFEATPLKAKNYNVSNFHKLKFKISNGLALQINMLISYLDNDFFKTSFTLTDSASNVLFEKDIYSRKGEFIALTGFSKTKVLRKNNAGKDFLLIFKPVMQK